MRTAQITTPSPILALSDPLFMTKTPGGGTLPSLPISALTPVNVLISVIVFLADLFVPFMIGPIVITILGIQFIAMPQVVGSFINFSPFFVGGAILFLHLHQSIRILFPVNPLTRLAPALEPIFCPRPTRESNMRNNVITCITPFQERFRWQRRLGQALCGVKVFNSQDVFSSDENVLRSGSLEKSRSLAGRFVF